MERRFFRSVRPGVFSALKLGVLFGLGLAMVYLFVAHPQWFSDPAELRSELLSWGIWAPAIYLILYMIGPSLLLPGAVMTLAAGLAFGAVRGALYALIGANIGAVTAFATGRFLGQDFVRRTIGSRFDPLFDRLARHGFQIIFYLRVFPIIPYNALNLIAGVSPIRFRDYWWATVLGLVPGTILFACLGNELWHPTSARFAATLALLAICFASAEYYRRRAGARLYVSYEETGRDSSKPS